MALCKILGGLLAGATLVASPAHAQQMAANADLQSLSIEQLANVEITSVSKAPQALSAAAAAVYVISHDDVIRSGATSLPEVLRLAPNLQVAQMGASGYAITARGFNGNAADKLLVLIDGRSVYTSLYGGVMWDEKDVLPENIERIEVISGPAGTLWGANAVNGVINIITRKAADTPGGILTLGVGNREARASLQYSGAITDDLNYRIYGETFAIPHANTSAGVSANDGWNKSQGGFRLDYTPGIDTLSLQGDYYQGNEGSGGVTGTNIWGGNIQGTWLHQLGDAGTLQLLGYYDGNRRYGGGQGYGFDTYDLEVQHSIQLFDAHSFVWGAGGRVYSDSFNFTGAVQFLPASRTQAVGNIFAQDSWTLSDTLTLVLGAKLEADAYTGLKVLPNARLSWKAFDNAMFWASYAHSVRAPTRFDVDLYDVLAPGIVTLTGDRNFKAETVRAFEVGSRIELSSNFSFSVSGFYNQYNNLRSVEVVQGVTLPLLWSWGNLLEANTYGAEVWGNYAVNDWWRLSASFNILHQDRKFKPTSSQLGGLGQLGDDPNHQAMLRSSMNLGDGVNLDADLRWIGKLPDPKVAAYADLNLRLGWQMTDAIELSLAGANLLQPQHLEYELAGATTGTYVYRSVFLQTRLHF
ncbi:MAG: TonB-dependent receptor, plug [Alphaproteobacteria bacterium]|nr:TonB-dependent receptor, plug [Alphaproteobacteria bacterium]